MTRAEDVTLPELRRTRVIVKKQLRNTSNSLDINIELEDKLLDINAKIKEIKISKKTYYLDNSKYVFDYYENKLEPQQWTLDRINNDIGHEKDNSVICCYKCNIKRGRIDDKKFKFTKQLRIIKGF